MMKHTKVALDIIESKADREEFVDIWETMSMLGKQVHVGSILFLQSLIHSFICIWNIFVLDKFS